MSFDGWTVTLTRLWCPVPRWRHRRFPLDRIVRTEYKSPRYDYSQVPTYFVVHLRAPEDRQALWLWVLRNLHDAAGIGRFHVVVRMINEAVAGRIRLVLKHSLGLGPWSDAEWSANEERAPESCWTWQPALPSLDHDRIRHDRIVDSGVVTLRQTPGHPKVSGLTGAVQC